MKKMTMVIVLVMMAGVAMAETLHPDGKGGYNSSKGHYSPDGKGGLNGPIGYLEPDGAGNFFGPHGEYYENIKGVLDGPDNYDTRQGTLVEETVEVIPEAMFRKRKKSNEYYRTNSVEVLRTPQGGFPVAGAGSNNAGYQLKVMADDAGISLNDAGATNSPIYEAYKDSLEKDDGSLNYKPSYNYKPSWSNKKKRHSKSNIDRNRCTSACISAQGICSGQCMGNGAWLMKSPMRANICLSNCSAAQARCVAMCR